MPSFVHFVGVLLVYAVIACGYGRLYYLLYSEHDSYCHILPPASLVGALWPISIPVNIAFSVVNFIHTKITGN